jgi:hypothetical protein
MLDLCLTRVESLAENHVLEYHATLSLVTPPITPPYIYASDESHYFASESALPLRSPSITFNNSSTGQHRTLKVLITDDNAINRKVTIYASSRISLANLY